MTPFAQLGHIRKQATAAPGYKYQKTSTGLNDPYLPQVAEVEPQSLESAVGWGAAELGADVAAGLLGPVTGVPWFAGKAIYQGLKGNWGQAASNLGMAGLSFVPMAASGAAAAKGALAAGRIANTAGKVGRVASSVNKYKGVISKGQELAATGVNAAKAVPAVAKVGELANTATAAAKASRAGQAVGAAVNTGRTAAYGYQPLGFKVGQHAWNAGAGTGKMMGAAGVQAAKQAPLDYTLGKIPNNPNLLPPTAPPPTPANPFSDSQIQSALSGDF